MVLSIGSVVIDRCQFDALGECEETMIIIWSGEVGGNMIANVDCIYAAVSKRHMPSDQRIEFILLCKLEMDTGLRYRHIKQSSHKSPYISRHHQCFKTLLV